MRTHSQFWWNFCIIYVIIYIYIWPCKLALPNMLIKMNMTISIERNIINFNHMTLIDLLANSCHNWLVFLTLNLHWFVSILACSIFTKDIKKTQYVVVKRSNCHFWRLWKGVASQVLEEVCYVWKIRGLVGGTLLWIWNGSRIVFKAL